jgi:hypothetical protein
VYVFGKNPDLQNSPSFLLDPATPPAKKRAAAGPLNCQVTILANQPTREKPIGEKIV